MSKLTYGQLTPQPEPEEEKCETCKHPLHGRYCNERIPNPETGLTDECFCAEYDYLDEYDYVCHCFDDPTIWDDEDE